MCAIYTACVKYTQACWTYEVGEVEQGLCFDLGRPVFSLLQQVSDRSLGHLDLVVLLVHHLLAPSHRLVGRKHPSIQHTSVSSMSQLTREGGIQQRGGEHNLKLNDKRKKTGVTEGERARTC